MRISTGRLNRAMEEVLTRHQPPVVKRVRAKFFYLTQAETAPPTFVFFVSDAERVPESYTRYLERALRKLFGISHAPMRIHLRSSHKKRVERHAFAECPEAGHFPQSGENSRLRARSALTESAQ